MRTVTASAPGKVILHGEHSVVYGKLALAVSIGLRTRVRIAFDEDGNEDAAWGLKVEIPDLGREHVISRTGLQGLRTSVKEGADGGHDLDQDLLCEVRSLLSEELSPERGSDNGLAALVYLFVTASRRWNDDTVAAVTIRVESDIPVGAGLGSSAAYSVALAGAFLRAFSGGGGGGASTPNNNKRRRTAEVESSSSSATAAAANNNVVKKGRKQQQQQNGVPADVGLYSVENGHHRRQGRTNGVHNGEAVNEVENKTFNRDELDLICARAFLAEKIIHGNPSGGCEIR